VSPDASGAVPSLAGGGRPVVVPAPGSSSGGGRPAVVLPAPVLVAMVGLPGAGKSAVADALGARISTTVVSVDPIESAILRAGVDAGQPTGLAAYFVAERMAESVLATGASVIVDAVNAVEPARYQWRELARRAVRCCSSR
jgi:predicted kinase